MTIKQTGELIGGTTTTELIEYIQELESYGNNDGVSVTVKKGNKSFLVSRVLVGPDYGKIGIFIELEEANQ